MIRTKAGEKMRFINYMRQNFTHEQRYILVAVLSLFLPCYFCFGILSLLFIRLLLTGEIVEAYKNTKASWSILLFCIIISLTSLFYQNWYGLIASGAIFIFLSLMLYYRRHVSKALFELSMTTVMYMSVLAAFYGLIEYVGILNKFDLNEFEIIVFNSPKYRLNSVFFNANYYAMMIEFFVLITFYKMLRIINEGDLQINIKKILELSSIIFINLFLLYLTGCRTAWPALMLGIVVMLFFNHNYHLFGSITALMGAGCAFLLIKPEYIPRLSNVKKYFGVRTKIWKTAIANIKTHFLFGEGPLTYWHIYPLYKNAHPTEHAHSIYIDPLLSYGIIGILSIIPYILNCLKRLVIMYKHHMNDAMFALIMGMIITTFIHGTMDLTVFFVQTGFLFMLVFSSFDVYRDRIDMIIQNKHK